MPSSKPRKGRLSGGVALLASARARVRVKRVEFSFIGKALTTFTDRGAFSGVYLPPSLPKASVATLLDSLSSSDVVLGDVNVRFPRLDF